MTRYKIKEQEIARNDTPDLLVAIRAQIESARLLIEAEKDPAEKKDLQDYISDLKLKRDQILQTLKNSRIANFKAQTDLLLDELSTKDYLSNLEKALRIKPVEVSKMTFVTKSVRKRRSKLIPNRINFIDTNK
jgi:hypothetical protein